MSIRILLAGDQGIVLEGLRVLLEAQPEMAVVGVVDDGGATVQQAGELSPDVVVLDMHTADWKWIEACRRMITAQSDVKVIALTTQCDRLSVERVLNAGASAYVFKGCTLDELCSAIHAVMENHNYLSPQITHWLVDSFVRHHSAGNPSSCTALTAREREVLQLVTGGKTTKDVALCLQLSPRTVDKHRHNIMSKLNVHKAAELFKYAVQFGLINIES
jgi:DNA-binding NarL/FixJ family response regulator